MDSQERLASKEVEQDALSRHAPPQLRVTFPAKLCVSAPSSAEPSSPVPSPIRRHSSVKLLPLVHGLVVLETPIPSRLLSDLPRQDGAEFTSLRYTAA
jgi:anti-sigma factor RsiW